MLAVLNSPQDYVLAVFLLSVLCSVCVILLCVCVYKLEGKSTKVQVTERVRPPREAEIDLAKERYDFESRRDAYLEAQMLRRVA